MAEKKTTKQRLSDRALELIMLNVLGGFEGTNKLTAVPDRSHGEAFGNRVEEVGSSKAGLISVGVLDPKLNS